MKLNNNKICFAVTLLILCPTFISGCNSKINSLAPGEIIAKAIDAEKSTNSCYYEMQIIEYKKNVKKDSSNLKVWFDANTNKTRSQIDSNKDVIITINDSKKMISYMKNEKTAFIYKSSDMSFNSSSYGLNNTRELLTKFLNEYKITNQDSVSVNGFDTIHLKGLPRNKKGIFDGNSELWIDKKSWMVVKVVTEAADSRIEEIYTKFDLKPSINPKLFDLKLPKGTKIQTDSDDSLNEKETSLIQVVKNFGCPVLYSPDNTRPNIRLSRVTTLSYNLGKIKRTEITEEYKKGNVVVFSLSFFKQPKKPSLNDSKIPGETNITIRGLKGDLLDANSKIISWYENGISYSFIQNDLSIPLSDIKSIINSLVYTNTQI